MRKILNTGGVVSTMVDLLYVDFLHYEKDDKKSKVHKLFFANFKMFLELYKLLTKNKLSAQGVAENDLTRQILEQILSLDKSDKGAESLRKILVRKELGFKFINEELKIIFSEHKEINKIVEKFQTENQVSNNDIVLRVAYFLRGNNIDVLEDYNQYISKDDAIILANGGKNKFCIKYTGPLRDFYNRMEDGQINISKRLYYKIQKHETFKHKYSLYVCLKNKNEQVMTPKALLDELNDNILCMRFEAAKMDGDGLANSVINGVAEFYTEITASKMLSRMVNNQHYQENNDIRLQAGIDANERQRVEEIAELAENFGYKFELLDRNTAKLSGKDYSILKSIPIPVEYEIYKRTYSKIYKKMSETDFQYIFVNRGNLNVLKCIFDYLQKGQANIEFRNYFQSELNNLLEGVFRFREFSLDFIKSSGEGKFYSRQIEEAKMLSMKYQDTELQKALSYQ
jgi:hypothetical protein